MQCDPLPVSPLCPERPIIEAAGCAYEGQTCVPASCSPGSLYRDGHVCVDGFWRSIAFACVAGMDDSSGF